MLKGQYTGLKDNRGYSIYEGSNVELTIHRVCGNHKLVKYVVVYSEGSFCLADIETGVIWVPLYKPSFTSDLWDTLKVIKTNTRRRR